MRKKRNQDENESNDRVYSQRYSLQRRDKRGAFRKVETFNERVTPAAVLERFGPGDYILKATKPRFATIWKQRLGTDTDENFIVLEHKAKFLGYGLVGVTATEIIGFGVSAWRFLRTDERLDKIETVLQQFKPDLLCANCNRPLDYFLQNHCGHCGVSIIWPRRMAQDLGMSTCLRCGFPFRNFGGFCTNCGKERSVQQGVHSITV